MDGSQRWNMASPFTEERDYFRGGRGFTRAEGRAKGPCLSVHRCHQCDYELTGLGLRGRCPECGQYFNFATGEGVRQPPTVQEHQSRLFGRIRTIGLGVLAVAAVLAGTLGGRFTMHPDRAIAMGIFFGAILALACVVSYVYEK